MKYTFETNSDGMIIFKKNGFGIQVITSAIWEAAVLVLPSDDMTLTFMAIGAVNQVILKVLPLELERK